MTEAAGVGGLRRVLALLALPIAVALFAPAARAACGGDQGGIGGTGHEPAAPASGKRDKKDGGGVGGTGQRGGDEGGIGGTGRRGGDEGGVGGTGIVGVVTGFGSVCVNGFEVEYDAATPVDVNGAPGDPHALAIGQVVAIEAHEHGGALHARHIAVRDAAVGPVERVDERRGEITVLAQTVRIDPATRVEGGIGRGDFVAVSGLRGADGHIAATRIEAVPARDRVSVTGPLAERPAGGAAIGALAVELPSGAPADLGDRLALVVGRIDEHSGALVAERVEPAVRFDRGIERLSVEGIVQESDAKQLRVGHVPVDATALDSPAAPGARVVVTGAPETGGRIRAERIEVVAPERPRAPDVRGGSHEREEHGEKPEKVEKPEKPEKVEKPEKPEKVEKPEKPEKVEKPEQPEKVERPEQPETPEHVERPEAPETPEVERPEAPEPPEVPEVERPEAPELPEVERPEAPELPEVERPETPELPEIERPEAPERPEFERPEAPELPEIERPEAPERPEVERPERYEPPEVELPERPEHDD